MTSPHKHAVIIKAWADGAEIEYFSITSGKWVISKPQPLFYNEHEYRIKPNHQKVFPETSLTIPYLFDLWFGAKGIDGSLSAVANAAIKQYILDTEK